ncbi:MAG: 30S ribosome-binding factor RbfA [Elusimicrobiota bacterium]
MKKSRRTDKLSSLVKKALSEIISNEISDPDMGIITITDVEVSIDLSIAKVFFSVIGGKRDIQKQKNIILHMNKFLRRRLAEKINLRYTPRIRMTHDDTPEKAHKLEMKFREIEEQRCEL